MENNQSTKLADEYLQSLEGMQAADPGPFFYTRLIGKMQEPASSNILFLKPAWIVGMLVVFFSMNCWMLSQKNNLQHDNTEQQTSLQQFVETYNLQTNTNY